MRSWADMPVGRVLRLVGADTQAVRMSLSPLPADAPAVVSVVACSAASPADMVAAVLAELETMAVDLYPAWLPEARGIDGPGGAGIAAVRSIALRMASTSCHFGPFLADLAGRALTGRALAGRPVGTGTFAAEIRAAGLARVIAASFGRTRAALLVLVPDDLPTVAQPALVGACEWLAQHSGLGVWLAGRPLTTVDRVESVTVRLPTDLADLVSHEVPRAEDEPAVVALEHPVVALEFPAVAGRPHPRSEAEQALARALRDRSWAAGHAWNQTQRMHPLANPIRVDLLWAAERCVVEIDGPEHHEALRYAADRRRDVQLQLHGYAVLRFTNAQVLHDMHTVLSQIERFVLSRRLGSTEGQRYAG